jgi:hypothetical protein
MSDFRSDYEWQLKFVGRVKEIVGALLVQPATFEMDTTEATDLIVLKARELRIACRVRRAAGEYAKHYPWEFTIRAHRDSGAKTEMEKIINGWGNWMFYGHADYDEPSAAIPASISTWFVIDLESWRIQLANGTAPPAKRKSNHDGTYLNAYDVRYFAANPRILIASSNDVPVMGVDTHEKERRPDPQLRSWYWRGEHPTSGRCGGTYFGPTSEDIHAVNAYLESFFQSSNHGVEMHPQGGAA